MVHIVRLCDGVYTNEDAATGPEQVEHEGELLHRLMDRYYIRGGTEDLTLAEVLAVCRARAQNFSMLGSANSEVHKIFKTLVHRLTPKRLLEIGAGVNPILDDTDLVAMPQMQYVKCDADPEADAEQRLFSESNSTLPYEAGFFDMAVAVFVLHFQFYEKQILELYRCLAPTGVFVANVYRRTEDSLDNLARSFEIGGFVVQRLLDPRVLCEGHQYWVCSKDAGVATSAMSEVALVAGERV